MFGAALYVPIPRADVTRLQQQLGRMHTCVRAVITRPQVRGATAKTGSTLCGRARKPGGFVCE